MSHFQTTSCAAGCSVLPGAAHHRQLGRPAVFLPPAAPDHQHRLASRFPPTRTHPFGFFSSSRPPVFAGSRGLSPRYAFPETRLIGENARLQNVHEGKDGKIRKNLLEVELLPSSYDTAWVAMVPLQGSPHSPHFPQCVEWILQNQQDDGSWGINDDFESSPDKDILLSTLACILPLMKWNVGQEHIRRGIHFIGRNISIVKDKQITTPIGFNIIFPGMLSLAIGMGLDFPIQKADIDGILHLRKMELKRQTGEKSYGSEAYMAYVAEGLGNLLDWKAVMKFQRKNGSLFNSPSTTAAVLVNNYDDKAIEYLNLLVSKFGGAVPTVYPRNIHCQLSMVDLVEKIGISRHFSSEVKGILDMTYRLWLQRDDEIMLDVATCAIAFRLLRMNGYDVSSDELSHVAESTAFHNSLQGYLDDTKSVLELYKASKVCLSEDELILDNIGYWSGNLLTRKIFSDVMPRISFYREMEYALKFPFYSMMERLDHKRNIEDFNARGSHMLKTRYLPYRVNQELLSLAVEDFTLSQLIYQDELVYLHSWVKENKLDQLQFARQKLTYCYLSAAATIFSPELRDARISWAKNGVLTTVIDDFFDVAGSKEELENLMALVEKWDEYHKLEFCSEQVKILFFALYTTVNELGSMASAVQNHCVRDQMIAIWLQLMRSAMTEADWQRSQYVPTMEEYMTNGVISMALGPIVLPAMYFVGEKISGCVVKDQGYNELFRLMSSCGRLLNDIQGFEREGSAGKLNSVSLLILHSGGSMSVEDAKKETHKSIETFRKDLLRLILQKDIIPRPCKDLFWKMCKILHLFYFQTDGFSSPKEMASAVNAVINEPLQISS